MRKLKELFKNILESLNGLEIFIGAVMLLFLLLMGFLVCDRCFGTKQTETESYTVVFLETEQQRRYNGTAFVNYTRYWCFAENDNVSIRFILTPNEYNKIKSGDIITIRTENTVGRWLKFQSTQYSWNGRGITESVTVTRKEE